jgi:hypothetical protein
MHALRELQELSPKTIAKRLRDALTQKNIKLNHGECLDLVAKVLGHKDWNVLSALQDGTPLNHQAIVAPEGWSVAGTMPHLYVGGVSSEIGPSGKAVFTLKCLEQARRVDGFVTIMQTFNATEWIGKRIRIACELRTRDVLGSATIWLRFDGVSGQSLGFSNLEDRPHEGSLKGTQDWCRRNIVLLVPEGTAQVAFGFYLWGAGEAAFSGFELSETGQDEPLTFEGAFNVPRNLDFAPSS